MVVAIVINSYLLIVNSKRERERERERERGASKKKVSIYLKKKVE